MGVWLFWCRCAADKGEDAEECKFFQRSYRSLCPGEWVRIAPAHGQTQRWDSDNTANVYWLSEVSLATACWRASKLNRIWKCTKEPQRSGDTFLP